MDVKQFRTEIIKPTLVTLDMWSEAAERLLIGTAAHESAGLRYIRQLGGGPARSFFQIEPATARDVVDRWLAFPTRRALADLFRIAFEWEWHGNIAARLLCDMRFSCAVARLIYWRDPEPLPAADNLDGLARYWKRVYNSTLGKGTTVEWIASYHRYVGDH